MSRERRRLMRSGKLAAWGTAALVSASVLASAAQAQDFFSQLFGGFARPRHQPYIQMPFGNDDGQVYAPRGEGRVRYGGGGGPAYWGGPRAGRPFPGGASGHRGQRAPCA